MSRSTSFSILISSISILATLTSVKVFCSSMTIESQDRQVSIEDRVASSGIVFRGSTFVADAASWGEGEDRGLDLNTHVVTSYFFVKSTYKGGEAINDLVANNFGRINVTFPAIGPTSKYKEDLETTPNEYIIFCNLINADVKGVAAVKWSENNDYRVWRALGWSTWSDWSSCSVSCSGGIQQRIRHCNGTRCHGFNVEQRHCNLFSCEDTINPLAIEKHKSFHPSAEKWERVPDRPTAWRLRPDFYIWLPSKELFLQENGLFPREFTIFMTFRLTNSTMGTIFSVRSRSRQDTYLSLEVTMRTTKAPLETFETLETLKVIHASTANGTDVVRIPARLDDGHWHQLAISFRDSRVLDIYIDCVWSKTEILRSHSLDIPDDSDLIIGYLFTGDVEQLSIIPSPNLANLQCEDNRVPITDYQEILNRFTSKKKRNFVNNKINVTRSTLLQENLEALFLMFCERELTVSIEPAKMIDHLCTSSKELIDGCLLFST